MRYALILLILGCAVRPPIPRDAAADVDSRDAAPEFVAVVCTDGQRQCNGMQAQSCIGGAWVTTAVCTPATACDGGVCGRP